MSTKASDIDIFEAYLEIGRRKLIAASLITFGHKQFVSAGIIKELDAVIKFYQESNDHLKEFPLKFPNILFDSLIDTVRISICFENYFKAKLLLNEFIIHNIASNKNSFLHKEQKDRPIEVKEITADKSLKGLSILKNFLNETTLNYSTLLTKEKYLKYFNINAEEVSLLIDLNRERNRLHLFLSENTRLSKKILSHYNELSRIVKFDIAFLQNTLLAELDPESRSKIPIKL